MTRKTNNAKKHSSPGLYFTDSVVSYSAKSLGITALGAVGETLKGPAFEPIKIADWTEFQDTFGGTSPEQYKGSKYPKYELPYIAKSYLQQSHNLSVVRVLGLSGVNAGPAWLVTAKGSTGSEYDNMVIMVLRSRGEHKKAAFKKAAQPELGICEDVYEYDGIEYYAKEVELVPSASLNLNGDCNPGFNRETGNFTVDSYNYGTFTIKVTLNDDSIKYYSVTLNPSDKNYIYNVIGGDPANGDAEVFVEELYDVALRQLVDTGDIVEINQAVVKAENINIVPAYEDVQDILTDPLPSRNMIGKRYLYSAEESVDENGMAIKVYYSSDNGISWGEAEGMNGVIYTVISTVDPETGKKKYFYGAYVGEETNGEGNIEYQLITQSDESYNSINNSTLWTSDCDSTQNNPRTLFETAPSATVDSPLYIKLGSKAKIISQENREYLYAEQGNARLSDVPAVTNFDGTECLCFEYSTPSNPSGAKFVIYNGDEPVKYEPLAAAMPDTIGTYDATTGVFNITGSYWRMFIDLTEDLGVQVSDYQNIRVAMLTTVNGVDEEDVIGKKTITQLAQTTNSKHKLEQLTEYNHTTDVEENDGKLNNCVKVASDDMFYINTGESVEPITLDFNNYKESYRWASTPWIISEMKGSADNVEVNKLFRFHAISDGEDSNTDFKISIENIDPTTGKFDVVIRDFYDSDLSVSPFEKYLSCNLVPGSQNYLGLKIGTTDGLYVSKSKYVTVEIIENDITKNSIPAGFMGYPVRDYSHGFILDGEQSSNDIKAPYFKYNTNVDDDIKPKKQYFGVSDIVGIDEDILKYKGVEAYNNLPDGLSPCFHLDSRIINGTPDENGVIEDNGGIQQIVKIDGIGGYSWVTVGKYNTTSQGIEPRIGTEAEMIGTIYEDKNYRKFTVALYGGWDGWDYYRTVRSTGDEFRYKEYKGAIDSASGYGTMFNRVKNPDALGFESKDKVITSDYYAWLAGVKQLGNPNAISVNLLTTSGVDYVYNKALIDEIIDVVEEDRGDLVYVITTPDKPAGAGDTIDEMFTAEDIIYNLEDSDIDSNHCTSYYPWVKYYDNDNYQYVFLPLTRDVVRSIAYTDNVKYSWYANAGWNRGNIEEGAEPRKRLKQEDEDTLYDGRMNFVKSFAEKGHKIWGDKNLQIEDNLLNRLSKRRLLLRIREMLKNSCIGLIFDPNDLTQSQTVRSAVSKVLDDVKTGRGITDYKIEIDDSAETRDQLGLNVVYHIKPVQALEWINFSSVLTPEGMQW